jgi:hypothetical protein
MADFLVKDDPQNCHQDLVTCFLQEQPQKSLANWNNKLTQFPSNFHETSSRDQQTVLHLTE